jgi:hypothetical protein
MTPAVYVKEQQNGMLQRLPYLSKESLVPVTHFSVFLIYLLIDFRDISKRAGLVFLCKGWIVV